MSERLRREESCSLPNGGTVVLLWNTGLTAEDLRDVFDWLDLVKRKMERSVEGASA